jgi:hypothetical protein
MVSVLVVLQKPHSIVSVLLPSSILPSVSTTTNHHPSPLPPRKGLQTFRETRTEAKVLSSNDFWFFRLR